MCSVYDSIDKVYVLSIANWHVRGKFILYYGSLLSKQHVKLVIKCSKFKWNSVEINIL